MDWEARAKKAVETLLTIEVFLFREGYETKREFDADDIRTEDFDSITHALWNMICDSHKPQQMYFHPDEDRPIDG